MNTNLTVHQAMAYQHYQPFRTQNVNIQKKESENDNHRSFRDILSEKMESSKSGLRR
ncbi:hypothetical protein [Paenibacillus sp. J22TS3]|uniref:hypothetical protein n=1 Tax=Paenibacillus sp. J22TS3 TaxID=2807192 RepID=UPI001B048D5A|nr:hypothetical protein [Paenibacillus sp. J22TS3]GIP22654.1 hypothetical protein J22TS3_29290 [Paenibacillus sp. J22TS3]